MSESVSVELCEHETIVRGNWQSNNGHPWTTPNLKDVNPPDEYQLPSGDWTWTSNWRVDKKPGMTDNEGWEYASRYERFAKTDRRPKTEKLWNDHARKRVWSRVMRREVGTTNKTTEYSKTVPKIQHGLSCIHNARIRIEEIMQRTPEVVETEQMGSLVQSVRKNMDDIRVIIDELDKQNTTDAGAKSAANAGVLKKLRHDCMKEEMAIDKALSKEAEKKKKKAAADGFKPLKRGSAVSEANPATARGNPFDESSTKPSPKASPNPKASPSTHSNGSGRERSISDEDKGAQFKMLAGENKSKSLNFNYGNGAAGEGIAGSSSSSQVIRGGAGKSFNPTVLSGKGSMGFMGNGAASGGMGMGGGMLSVFSSNSEGEEGVFINRQMQEQLIAQKLQPVGEMVVMQELIDERAEAIDEVYKSLVEVNEMFSDLSRIVKEQQVDVDAIHSNVEESHAKTKEGFEHIVEANKLQQEAGACVIS